jgi:hypothetical protein
MTNFVYPSYFEVFRKPGSDQFDYSKKVHRPFQILSGGYQIIFKNGKWSQVYGSIAKARRFRKENRDQHRSEFRKLSPAKRRVSKADWGKIVKRY